MSRRTFDMALLKERVGPTAINRIAKYRNAQLGLLGLTGLVVAFVIFVAREVPLKRALLLMALAIMASALAVGVFAEVKFRSLLRSAGMCP
ncbi:MAG: hypothetical protein ACRED8_08405 [Caulobacteraceae bacterium]